MVLELKLVGCLGHHIRLGVEHCLELHSWFVELELRFVARMQQLERLGWCVQVEHRQREHAGLGLRKLELGHLINLIILLFTFVKSIKFNERLILKIVFKIVYHIGLMERRDFLLQQR